MHRMETATNRQTEIMVDDGHKTHINSNSNPGLNARGFHLLHALQKTPSLLGAECKGVVRHRSTPTSVVKP